MQLQTVTSTVLRPWLQQEPILMKQMIGGAPLCTMLLLLTWTESKNASLYCCCKVFCWIIAILFSSWCCVTWAKKKVILLAKEFLSDVCGTPCWDALTRSQIPSWCSISALQFTLDVTQFHSHPVLLNYFHRFLSSVFHTRVIFCICFASLSEGLEQESAKGEVFLSGLK